jgi:nicotinate-nucleotide adenylyltransferase
MRLGLLGGSFNPVHYGHLGIARHARETLQLDQVVFIPTGDPPHKRNQTLAPARDRYEMVRLAIAGAAPYFSVSDTEVLRKGKSYSIDTVLEFRRQYGTSTELHFLIGLDAFLDLATWKDPQALLKVCRFVVLSRPGKDFGSLTTLPMLPKLDAEALAELDAGKRTQLDIAMPSSPGVVCLSLPHCTISASDIRRRIRLGLPLANLLPQMVESYILRRQLYKEDSNHTHI